jgi:hypothetical protein
METGVDVMKATPSRYLFRFVVGGTALTGDWLDAALRAVEQLSEPADEPPALTRGDLRAVLIGAVSAALRWRVPVTPPRSLWRAFGRPVRTGAHLLAHLPGAGLATRPYRRLHDRIADRLRRWGEEGAREDLAGRRLARVAVPAFFELAVAYLSESPELRIVIQEQSEGLASSSVNELRDRSELADRLVERVVRRLLLRNGTAAKTDAT